MNWGEAMSRPRLNVTRVLSLFFPGTVVVLGAVEKCRASNHLDTSVVIANPQANIGDIYAWMAPHGRHLNLVMEIVGRSFSDKLRYVFYIASGPGLGKTTATTTIACRFPDVGVMDCRVVRR